MLFQSNGYKHEGVEPGIVVYIEVHIFRRRLVATGKFFEEIAHVLTTM